jgi:Alginate lyase
MARCIAGRRCDLKRKLAWVISGVVLSSVVGLARQNTPTKSARLPRVFVLDGSALKALREQIAANGARAPALLELRTEADRTLKLPPLSVIQKQQIPPSGDKHDYMSLAPYWWPNPNTPDGLPYVRRDGETNPGIQRVPDHKNFDRLISATHTLALAYYLFGEEAYASHATELLRAWFLEPATRMNPHLDFAQAVVGRNEGRGTGLIETRRLSRVVDTIGMLAGSQAWTEADRKGTMDWCARYLAWMQDSPNGKQEAEAKNNHGTYYDVQVASLALFTGNTDLAKRVLRDAANKRIAVQIEPDGRQPLELERTKSLGYSTMNISGLFELARLGESAGVDLWNFQTRDGRSILKALDFLLPYATGARRWPYKQIATFQGAEIVPVLLIATEKYRTARYREAAAKIDPASTNSLDALLIRCKKRH